MREGFFFIARAYRLAGVAALRPPSVASRTRKFGNHPNRCPLGHGLLPVMQMMGSVFGGGSPKYWP
jgi:hypothetical protein